ncbi:hypothetical protein N0M98_18810 [Paenibacillus doosanensis]|uniref:SPW repeat-containing integral membrane domain-containing protein n=1 Tax=Paenibacillus konkukensis TaxID=2020716 RepID=A0ABY4RLD8_9BACL|nr:MULTISPECIES: hypothetical protein [Paenibacillus]MCS7462194.1 hypothetical protein [Paenibacillus doosanensis]UQZ82943.1 hypothetical protein SK3146_02103 [Paenibacillus konkukensis]
MAVKNLLAALIGLLFVFAPHWIQFAHESAVVTSVVFGSIQFIASLFAFYLKKPGWNSWFNWLSMLSGIWFVIFPFAYLSGLAEYIIYIALGITTVMLNYYTMNEDL